MVDWRETTLGDISDSVGGIIQTGPFGSQLHESDYSVTGVPVVMPKNIIEGRVSENAIARVRNEHVERLARHKLAKGDIVYGRRGDIGRQALVGDTQAGWLCGTGCLRISLGTSVVDPLFLHYYLRQESVIKWIAGQAVGATMPNLNTGILRSVPVHVPPLPIQKQIAGILSAFDELIENNQRRIKVLEEMARSLYREWFVYFRYPGHAAVPLADSPLGPIPQRWEVKKVGDLLAKLPRQKKVQKQDYLDHGALPVIDQGRELIGGFTDNVESAYTSDLPVVVFGDHTRVLKFVDFPFACGADGTQLLHSSDERMPISLLYYTVSNIDLSNYGYARHFKFLKEEEVIVPSVDVAKALTGKVRPMHKHMSVLQKQMDNLRNTRDLVLPKLLSGEIDLLKVEEGP